MSEAANDLLGYAITGKEFVAMDDLKRFGIEHWRATRIEFERRGKQRLAEPHEYPALHNYIWLQPTNAQMAMLSKVRFLGGTFHWLSSRAVQAFSVFRQEVEARLAQQQIVIDEMDKAKQIAADKALSAETRKAEIAARRASIKAMMVGFREGDPIIIRDGLLAGEMATFKRIVVAAQDVHPFIQAEVEMMGRVVQVKVDPLDVRPAANS